MKTVLIICSLIALATALSVISCPDCDPEAGCWPGLCHCVRGNDTYHAPNIPTKSAVEGCPDCPAAQRPEDCSSAGIRLLCDPVETCSDEQLANWNKEINYANV